MRTLSGMSDTERAGFPWRDINILGTRIAATNIHDLLDVVDRVIESKQSLSIAFTGVHGIMEAQDSSDAREVFAGVSVRAPDGMPLVVAGRLLHGIKGMGRCYGPDFMLAAMERSVSRGHRHFF